MEKVGVENFKFLGPPNRMDRSSVCVLFSVLVSLLQPVIASVPEITTTTEKVENGKDFFISSLFPVYR